MECQACVGKEQKALLYTNLSVNAHERPREHWLHSRMTREWNGDFLCYTPLYLKNSEPCANM